MNIAKLRETIQIALSQLSVNKMRTALTMLGITIGVASVIILVSVGQGVENFVVSQFAGFGSRMVFVSTVQDPSEPPGDGRIVNSALNISDLEILSNKSLVPDASDVGYFLVIPQYGVYDGETIGTPITGVSLDYFDIMQIEIGSGRLLNEDDLLHNEPVAVVGEEIVEDVFDGKNPIGEAIRVGSVSFRIVGVLANMSVDFPGFASNDSIVIPVTTAQRRLSGERTLSGDYPVTGFLLQARTEEVVNDVVNQAKDALYNAHDIALEDRIDSDFRVIAQQTITEVLSSITGLLTVFLGAIAGISLIVGGIGIMNIMLVTVTERTREIGLRKAVGAREGDILFQFLVESVTLSVIGGIIGTLLAIVATMLIGLAVPDLNVSVQPDSVVLATAISIGIGGFFGAFPAQRAAAMSPIDALRYE